MERMVNNGRKAQMSQEKPEKEALREEEEKREEIMGEDEEVILDFTTSSAISRVNIKFLAVYLPLIWICGLGVAIFWYEWTKNLPPIQQDWKSWLGTILLLPFAFLCMYFIFIVEAVFFGKLFLTLVNLIHQPKEGIFRAELGDNDFEFWCLRTELKKFIFWLIRNCPIPWIDVLAFKWYGIQINFSSHLNDAWCDGEFMKFGRKVMAGQASVLMCSMVVGNYLIIKKVIFDDYIVIGGISTIAPGTIMGRDTVLGAVSITTYDQLLEAGWIYSGIPARKYKPNKLHELRRDVIAKIIVDEEARTDLVHEVNVEQEKKDLA